MKKASLLIAAYVWLGVAACVRAEGEPLVPPALNSVLPGIRAGMSAAQVEAVLDRAYPGVKGRKDLWSGQTGYIAFKLDKRFSLSVSAITKSGKDVVHDAPLLYVYDWEKKRRVELKVYDWEEKESAVPSEKKNNGEQE